MTSSSNYLPRSGLLAALLVLTCVRLVFAAKIDFLEDEAYYRLWGLYPSYAYFDHAPMAGWWIAIGQNLFGDTYLGLRFLSPIASGLGSLFLWRTAFLIYGARTADLAVIILNAVVLMGIGSVIMTPDVPSVFFWALTLWALSEWDVSGRNHWWLVFGAAAGLGLLSKYTNGFLGAGVLLWLILSGRWKDAIRAPQFWLAGVLAVTLFSPVIYWNMHHEWASFAKQLGRLQPNGLTGRYFVEWIAGQALIISPLIFIFFAIAVRRQFQDLHRIQSLNAAVFVTTWPLLGYFLSHVFSSRINANWTAPVFLNFALLAAPIMVEYRGRNRIWRGITKSAVPLGFIVSFAVLIEALSPIIPVLRINPIEQIRGYPALAAEVESLRNTYGAKAVVTSRYQLTAMLSYQFKDKAPIVQLNDRIRYVNMPMPNPELLSGRVLYIANEREADGFIEFARTCIKSAEPIGDEQRRDRGVVIANYKLWLLEGVHPGLLARGDPADCY